MKLISGNRMMFARIFSKPIIFFLLGSSGLISSAQAYTYEVQTIPLTGELTNFSGQCFLEDSDGFMWFGSNEGLYRYHGTGFKVFRNLPGDTNSLSDNGIARLHEDADGVIWIATFNGGLNRFDRQTETFTRFLHRPGDSTSLMDNALLEIVEDRQGYLWVGTGSGFSRFDKTSGECRNFRLNTSNYKAYYEYDHVENVEMAVWYILIDNLDSLWIIHQLGTDKFDRGSGRLHHISNAVPCDIIQDRFGNIWVAGTGLYYLSREKWLEGDYLSGTIHLSEPGYPDNMELYWIETITEDESGNLWMRKSDGLYCYSRDMDTLFFWEHPYPYSYTGEYNNLMRELFIDSHGSIWFYTREGIHQVVKKYRNFRVYEPDPKDSEITCLALENDDKIWFGTLHGIYSLERSQNKFTFHYGDTWNVNLSSKKVNRLFLDSEGTLWTGMLYEGLFRSPASAGLVRQFVKYPPLTVDSITGETLNFSWIRQIFEDSRGRIWIGSKDGPICYYDKEEDRFIRLVNNPDIGVKLLESAQVRHESPSGILWASGQSGLFRILPPFTRISPTEVMASDIQRCRPSPGSGFKKIPDINTSHLDSVGNIWLATQSKGLLKLSEQGEPGIPGPTFRIEAFTKDDGLPENTIRSILPDGRGDLWIGTSNGLSHFDIQAGTFTNYYWRHGLPSNDFLHESAARNSKGEMFFGTSRGIVSFFPDSIHLNRIIPPVKLTDLKIDNRSILPGEHSPLNKSILYTDRIDLKYDQNNITLEYAVLNFEQPAQNRFRYILEGQQNEWIEAGNRSRVDFTNLRPGRYTFRVTGSNNDGFWNEEGASLQIQIHPPPWQTWYAYLVYGLIVAGIILWYRRYLQNRARLRMDVEVERIEKEKVMEMDQMRSRFFANISHEFRTPLTLIRGPLDELNKIKSGKVTLSRDLLDVMRRNTRRLQRLINQLLDISKLETGNVKLQVSEGNFPEFVRTIVLSFLSLAESKKIKYTYDLPETSLRMYFDADKLEKILTNLISNAFKFTPREGEVRVTLDFVAASDSHDQAVIKVSDTGKGMPPENLDRIFDRFYQVSDSETREEEGTGIGLALTRELVTIYRGEIRVSSQVGKGSEFIVNLPVSRDAFKEEEIIDEAPGMEPASKTVEPDSRVPEPEKPVPAASRVPHDTAEKPVPAASGTPGDATEKSVLLIVEDNLDLRNYISNNLSGHYQILTAENGSLGLESAEENIPDLIISDLMMPVMDGMEMCRRLKKLDSTSHIPVIMLTAKADRGSKLKGLEIGADDYLVKPFDPEELQVRVRNLIRQRELLREKFRKEFLTSTETPDPASPKDELLKKILDTLNRHVPEPEFNMDRMSEELNMSRRQLFRKVNAVTGYTPNDLLRNIRLKSAATLFKSGEKNISQVMYQVGFNNHSYFTKCFRELYRMNPSDFLKDQIQN